MNTTHQSRRKHSGIPYYHFFISLTDAMRKTNHADKKDINKQLLAEGYDPMYSGTNGGFYINKPFNF